MKNCIFLCVITVATALASKPRHPQEFSEISIKAPLSAWHAFKAEHEKQYVDEAEEEMRRELFFKNFAEIEAHNADPSQTYKLGVYEFADLSKEELKTRLQSGSISMKDYESQPRVQPESEYVFTGSEGNVVQPASIDYRVWGIVSPVKNQGQCGGSWSFAATGALESATGKKYNRLVQLSEQNLIDCSSSYGNKGCSGGSVTSAFAYVKANGGIQTMLSYPFTGSQGTTCRYNRAFVGATCTGYTSITRGSETDLQSAVASVGPIAVTIDASSSQFANYKSGIFNLPSCSNDTLTHSALVVGYGTDNRVPYWLVKNSRGLFWGELGYIRMIRNANNQCGIASMASYPTV